jgi:hypothetical protein
MGLQMTYKIGGDLPIIAYIKIKTISIYYNPPEIKSLEGESKSKGNRKHIFQIVDLDLSSGRGKNVLEVLRGQWKFIYDEKNKDSVLVQGYNYLKSLPEFTGAFDVLEE